jgi:hypothetical protein
MNIYTLQTPKVCPSIGIFCMNMQKIHKCNRLLGVYPQHAVPCLSAANKQTAGTAAGSGFCLIADPATRHSPDECMRSIAAASFDLIVPGRDNLIAV